VKPHEIVAHANTIAREYQRQGLRLTLRQLYYQFVARGLTGNGQKVYKRIGAAMTSARLAGAFDVELIEDRGRSISDGGYGWSVLDVDEGLDLATQTVQDIPAEHIFAARWEGQQRFVSVWVEKKALSGVFQRPCQDLAVPLFPCAGYPSVSALYAFLQAARAATRAHPGLQEVVVLYFGDHDPDGWEIPRSAARNLATLNRTYGVVDLPIRFERVALNMDQIEAFDPPPFPAKVTSSRYQRYVDEHGTNDAWELDALDPGELQRLIRNEVTARFDGSVHREVESSVGDARAALRRRMSDPEWILEALGGGQ
jgi:hypothetical protein